MHIITGHQMKNEHTSKYGFILLAFLLFVHITLLFYT